MVSICSLFFQLPSASAWKEASNVSEEYMPTNTYWTFPDNYYPIKWKIRISHPDKIICRDAECGFYASINVNWEKDTNAGFIPLYPEEALLKQKAPSWISNYFSEIDVTDNQGKIVHSLLMAHWEDGIGNETNTMTFIPYEFTGPTSLTIFPKLETTRKDNVIFANSVFSEQARLISNTIFVEEFVDLEIAQIIEEDSEEWSVTETNIQSDYEISKGFEDAEEPDFISISCKRKKWRFSIWAPDAISRNGKGKGTYVIDDGNPIRFTYQRSKNSSLVYLTNSRLFISKLINSESVFRFDIETSTGSITIEHSKANLNDYLEDFEEAGCKLP